MICCIFFFFFKQKTAYEITRRDWSSDVCSSDLVEFLPGVAGSLVGEGVVVFEAANGDLLVGIMTWHVDPAVDDLSLASIHFSWRDSVEFDDGTIVSNTGRFVTD